MASNSIFSCSFSCNVQTDWLTLILAKLVWFIYIQLYKKLFKVKQSQIIVMVTCKYTFCIFKLFRFLFKLKALSQCSVSQSTGVGTCYSLFCSCFSSFFIHFSSFSTSLVNLWIKHRNLWMKTSSSKESPVIERWKIKKAKK